MTMTILDYEQQKQHIDLQLTNDPLIGSHFTDLLEKRARIDTKIAELEKPALSVLKKQAAPRPRPASRSGRKRALSSKLITTIRTEYGRGKTSLATLAKKYHVSPGTIFNYVKGIPKTQAKSRGKIEKDEVKLVVNMYRSGLTMRQIGQKFGVSSTTVWNTIRVRAGVKARYSRKKSEQRTRQVRAAVQPVIHIDHRLGMSKKKRGTKHNNEGRIKASAISSYLDNVLVSDKAYDTYTFGEETFTSDPNEVDSYLEDDEVDG